MGNPGASPPTSRLISLDAYRGFVMLAMASSGFHLARVCSSPEVMALCDGNVLAAAWRWGCTQLAFHTEHVPWGGCSFWDLIQPSFMFMVGVAMPFSYAARDAQGHSLAEQFGHVLIRSAILVGLGVFLASNGKPHTHFTFTNVLAQIGLGYPVVWLMLRRGAMMQSLLISAILIVYWVAFYQHPLPAPDFDLNSVGLPDDWPQFQGIAAHWNKNTNWAADVDVRFLNLFPQYDSKGDLQRFVFNEGGYQTLNFIPSMATMIFGLMTGEWLRSQRTENQKLGRMIAFGFLALAGGLALDPLQLAWPETQWSLCPIVKRIWSPSWVIYSTGWTLLLLSVFYWLIDVRGWKSWSFPLRIVGMNSIAMYCGAQLLKPWIGQTLKTHFSADAFAGPAGGVIMSVAQLAVLWLVCFWMYRNKIFVRI